MTMRIGTNLLAVSYYSPEQPFINIFKTGSGWGGTIGVTRYNQIDDHFNLDADGYPTTMVGNGGIGTFSQIDTLFLRDYGLREVNGSQNAPFYPSGQYVLLYDGSGTITYTGDGVKNVGLSAAGRDVLDVATPSTVGITVIITATSGGGNHIRNMRLCHIDNETALGNGDIFNPTFITRMSPFKTIRFMNWADTNNTVQTDWADRPTLTQCFYGITSSPGFVDPMPQGVPVEIMVALCNEIGADGWFCMPGYATDAYVTSYATLVHSTLNSPLLAYTEYANEVWNDWPNSPGVETRGYTAYPSSADDYTARVLYGIKRAVKGGELWQTAFGGDAARVKRVAAGQAGNFGLNDFFLDFTAGEYGGNAADWTGAAGNHFDVFATAPYFAANGHGSPASVNALFSYFTSTLLPEALSWADGNQASAAVYGLPLVNYEGGGHYIDSDLTLQQIFTDANRDARMGEAYTQYLQGLQTEGVTVFCHYKSVSNYSQFGYWGALENIEQTSTPKYDALVAFAEAPPTVVVRRVHRVKIRKGN